MDTPYLKKEDIKVGMRVIDFQLDKILGQYIILVNTKAAYIKGHFGSVEGTIAYIGDWGTKLYNAIYDKEASKGIETLVIIHNDPRYT